MSGIRPSTDVDARRAPDAPGVPIRRVLKAYEQIAEQLRELIASGKLSPGERLPNEGNLARQFGVSRATVRESLRVLTAQNLIRTAKGSGGGSYVTLPTVDHLSEFLRANFDLLTASQDVSLDDFLEIRMLLEVPAARLAAERRDAGLLERLHATIPEEPLKLTTQDQFVPTRRLSRAKPSLSRSTTDSARCARSPRRCALGPARRTASRARRRGENTEQILADLCGYSPARIAELAAAARAGRRSPAIGPERARNLLRCRIRVHRPLDRLLGHLELTAAGEHRVGRGCRHDAHTGGVREHEIARFDCHARDRDPPVQLEGPQAMLAAHRRDAARPHRNSEGDDRVDVAGRTVDYAAGDAEAARPAG